MEISEGVCERLLIRYRLLSTVPVIERERAVDRRFVCVINPIGQVKQRDRAMESSPNVVDVRHRFIVVWFDDITPKGSIVVHSLYDVVIRSKSNPHLQEARRRGWAGRAQ